MIYTPQSWRDFYNETSSFSMELEVTLRNGVSFTLYPENISMGSPKISQSICEPGGFSLGSINASSFGVDIINSYHMFDGMDFKDASIRVKLACPSYYIYKGKYYVDKASFNGNLVSLTSYDIFAQPEFDNADLDGYSTGGGVASWILGDLMPDGINYSGSITSGDINIPNFTVGAEGSPLSAETTRRQFIQYVLEICGAYIVCNATGDMIFARNFPLYDFTDDLDGGSFTYTDGDAADGGLFLAPFADDFTDLRQESWTYYIGNEHYSFSGNGNHFHMSGYNSGNYLTDCTISNNMNLPVGQYTFSAVGESHLNSIVIRNVTKNREYTNADGGITFYNDSADNVWRIIFRPWYQMSSTTLDFDVYLTNYAWLGESAFQMVWKTGDVYDGGYLNFLNHTTVTEANELQKIMGLPASSERKTITGVRITGSKISPVMIGNDNGEVIEIKDNPLIFTQSYAQEVAENLMSALAGINYCEFNVSLSADPRFEPGDIVSFDDNTKEVITLCTGFDYSLGNISNIY